MNLHALAVVLSFVRPLLALGGLGFRGGTNPGVVWVCLTITQLTKRQLIKKDRRTRGGATVVDEGLGTLQKLNAPDLPAFPSPVPDNPLIKLALSETEGSSSALDPPMNKGGSRG